MGSTHAITAATVDAAAAPAAAAAVMPAMDISYLVDGVMDGVTVRRCRKLNRHIPF
jgi:hypothetical protein